MLKGKLKVYTELDIEIMVLRFVQDLGYYPSVECIKADYSDFVFVNSVMKMNLEYSDTYDYAFDLYECLLSTYGVNYMRSVCSEFTPVSTEQDDSLMGEFVQPDLNDLICISV